jgi:hypothetical protein
MRLILKLTHWQVLLLFCMYLSAIAGLLILTHYTLPDILENFMIAWVTVTVYPLLLGFSLNKYIVSASEENERDFKTFKISVYIWTVVFFANEVFRSQFDIADNRPEIQVPRVVIAIICLFAWFKFVQYPSRIINSTELKREAGFWEYIADAFQIFCWPLCIWWLQPRINKLNDKRLKTS